MYQIRTCCDHRNKQQQRRRKFECERWKSNLKQWKYCVMKRFLKSTIKNSPKEKKNKSHETRKQQLQTTTTTTGEEHWNLFRIQIRKLNTSSTARQKKMLSLQLISCIIFVSSKHNRLTTAQWLINQQVYIIKTR